MNLKEHLTDESLREYLKGSLYPESERAVGLHLSFCTTCREARNAVLLDLSYPSREQRGESAGPHSQDKDFRDFWSGAPQDSRRIEEVARHCLQCRPCRDRRYRVWQELRAEAEVSRWGRGLAEAGLLTVLIALARRRRRATWVALALVCVCVLSLIPIYMMGRWQAPTSLSVGRNEGAEPGPMPDVQLAVSATPEVVPKQKSQPHGAVTYRPTVRPTPRIKPVGEAQEQLSRYQGVNLQNDPNIASFRGSDEDSRHTRPRRKVVISRKGQTKLDITLPEDGWKGTYLVYVQEPVRLATLAEGKGFSPDGTRLPISIDMRRLLPGEYVLCITRRDDKTGTEEYLGHFPIQAVASVTKRRPKRK